MRRFQALISNFRNRAGPGIWKFLIPDSDPGIFLWRRERDSNPRYTFYGRTIA